MLQSPACFRGKWQTIVGETKSLAEIWPSTLFGQTERSESCLFYVRGLPFRNISLLLVSLLIILIYDFISTQLHYLRLPKDIKDYHIFLMDATVATGAAAMMAIRVLLDHDVPEENITLCSLLMAESGEYMQENRLHRSWLSWYSILWSTHTQTHAHMPLLSPPHRHTPLSLKQTKRPQSVLWKTSFYL